MPRLCAKCGTYDPARQFTADSRCPSCGVLYAKLPRPSARPESTASGNSSAARASFPAFAPGAGWVPPKRAECWSSLAAVGVLFAILIFDQDGFVLLLDHANLAFHEAGHLCFGLLGSTPGLYGGTLGQLVFPSVAMASFWRRRQAVAVALSGVWLFENFLNIARYMADARARLLPLVGGGEHDWFHIFSRWGLLNRDTAIASATATLGWLGMAGCMLWLWRRYRRAQAAA